MRIIGIVSGKGGVGKTTLTSNLGIALSKFGKDVTLVDCNVTTSHLGFSFGIYDYNVTLNNVLRGENTFEEALIRMHGVKLLPASLSLESLIGVDINSLKDSIRNFLSGEIILLDSAPGLGKEALAVLNACDETIFITVPYLNAVADVMRCTKLITQLGIKPLGIVVNMVRGEPHELKAYEIEELTELPVIAEIPWDSNVLKSLAEGLPVILFSPKSPASIEIARLAASLIHVKFEPPLNFFDRIKRFFFSILKQKTY